LDDQEKPQEGMVFFSGILIGKYNMYILFYVLLFSMRYPPYTQKKMGIIQWVSKKKLKTKSFMSFVPFFVFGTVAAYLFKVDVLLCLIYLISL
jgi:hypothetical protein